MEGGTKLPKGMIGYITDEVTLDFNEETQAYNNVASIEDISSGEKFNSLADAKTSNPKKIRVTIEATHDGKTENFTIYVPDNMENSSYTWTSPFPKPVLKNHNTHGDPLGRVSKATFGDSITHPGAKTIFLTLDISDKEAIERFLDGRYSTVSIGGMAKEMSCNICGTDLLKDSFCGHWRGDKYSIKRSEDSPAEILTCYWKIGDMEYEEVSVVNRPADKKQTGPVSIEPVTEEEEKTSQDKSSDSKDTSDIDGLTDSQKENPVASTGVEDAKDTEEDKVQDTTVKDNVLELEKALKDNQALKSDIETLKLSKSSLSDELQTLKDEKAELEEQISFRTDQNITLGVEFKKVLTDAIKSLMDTHGIVPDEAHDFASMSLVDLKSAYTKTKELADKSTMATEESKVTSPGIVDNENTQGVNIEDTKKKKTSISDIISNIVK